MPLFLKNDNFIPAYSGVFHGFFGRRGGVSEGIYQSLNCGPGTDDDPENVRENRRLVAEDAGVGADRLLSLYQVHGDLCLAIDGPFTPQERPRADAMVTTRPGIGLGILTADCAPVLFYGRTADGPVVGAAHAGWTGAFQGILDSTVEKLQELGAERESIRAIIGPCIAPSSYEVTSAFADPFLTNDPRNGHFFKPGTDSEHLYFDLPGYCAKRLASAGVRNVIITGEDTYANKENYFSYRRSTHENAPDYGRQISVIAIRG